MRTRRTYFKDYKLNEIQVAWLKGFCKRPENKELLEEAAKEANPDAAEYVINGLANGWSYNETADKTYVPYNYEDFYGYCRKTLFLLWEKLLQNSEIVMKYWIKTKCVRRFLSVGSAASELNVSDVTLKRMAKSAGAYFEFGSLRRVDMERLYTYLDKNPIL